MSNIETGDKPESNPTLKELYKQAQHRKYNKEKQIIDEILNEIADAIKGYPTYGIDYVTIHLDPDEYNTTYSCLDELVDNSVLPVLKEQGIRYSYDEQQIIIYF